jgi:hypothetical protein
MLAFFQSEGKTPLRREILIILHKEYFKIDAPSLRIRGLMPSGPMTLDISRILDKSRMSDSVILILFRTFSDSDKIFGFIKTGQMLASNHPTQFVQQNNY